MNFCHRFCWMISGRDKYWTPPQWPCGKWTEQSKKACTDARPFWLIGFTIIICWQDRKILQIPLCFFHSKPNNLLSTVNRSSSLRQKTFLCSVMVKEVLCWTSEKSGFLFLCSSFSLFPCQLTCLIMHSYINKGGSSVTWVRRWGVNWQVHAKSPQYLHFSENAFVVARKNRNEELIVFRCVGGKSIFRQRWEARSCQKTESRSRLDRRYARYQGKVEPIYKTHL